VATISNIVSRRFDIELLFDHLYIKLFCKVYTYYIDIDIDIDIDIGVRVSTIVECRYF
jgi:hypothetical protein